MSVIETFDRWYDGLTTDQKRELIDHILQQIKELKEGIYAGPSASLAKGLFAGPSGTSQGRCPLCGR